MSRFVSKRRVVVAGIIATLAFAAAAIAYWTTSGSGTGTATTGTSTAVTVSQVGTVSALVPGSPAQAVDFTIHNPASTKQYIAHVAVSIASVQSAPGVAAVGCSSADFTLVQPTWTAADLPAGDSTFSPSGATLAMIDSASNQDGCKNVTVNLAFSAT